MRKTKALKGHRVWAWACAWALVLAAACGARVVAQGAAASVTGRVTDGKRGLAGIAVVLMPDRGSPWSSDSSSAKTDAEGRYRVSGLAPGRYQVTPVAPAHVLAEGLDVQRSRTLLLAAGETVENVDFRLIKGGVITGRVTGSDGKPLVGEYVRITVENGGRPAHAFFRPDRTESLTDDRGVYRIYGLQAGRYLVSVGMSVPPRGPRNVSTGGTQTFNQLTYYPSVTDAAQAKLVEVTEGGEATDIDISVEKTTRQTYTAAGRVVFADTNQPAANVRISYTPAGRGRGPMIDFGAAGFVGPGASRGVVTDARGEFKLEGLVSGSYAAFAVREGSVEWYSEQVLFEISDADAEGIEVRLRRGSSLSGVVQIEGVSDRATLARLLSSARLFAFFEQPGGSPPAPGVSTTTNVNPDGSFRFTGLKPGRVRLNISGGREANIMQLRVEHNGANASPGIEVAEGAQVTGARVVAAHGSAVIRGQVNVTGAPLAAGWMIRVTARRIGEEGQFGGARTVEVDSRGHFIIENLVAGEYEINAMAFPTTGRGGGGAQGATPPPRFYSSQRQRMTVAPGGEHTVALAVLINEGANQ